MCSRCASVLISGNRNRRLRSRRRSTSSSIGAPNHETPTSLPPERTDSIAWCNDRVPARPCFGLPPAHSKTTSAPLPPVSSRIDATGSSLAGIDRDVRAELARDLARLVAHVDGDDQPCPARPGDLQAFEPHAPLPEDRDRITDVDSGRLDGRHAVAQGLQAGGFAVRDAIVHLHEGDFRQERPLGETARKLKADDRSLAAKVIPAVAAERAASAGELRPRRHPVAGSHAFTPSPTSITRAQNS